MFLTHLLQSQSARLVRMLVLLGVVVGTSHAVLSQTRLPEGLEPPSLAPSSVMFIENVGQFDEQVRFYAYGASHTLWLAEDGVWVTLAEKSAGPQPGKLVTLKLSLWGASASPPPRLEPFGRLETTFNYYRGRDQAGWYDAVPAWGGVRYRDVAPGLDLELSGQGDHLAWRLVGRGKSLLDLSDLLHVEGADDVTCEGDHWRLSTAVGTFTLPMLAVEGATPLTINNLQLTLNNPPSLLAGMFVGADDLDGVEAVAVDQAGYVYVTGYTGGVGIYWPDYGVSELTDAVLLGRFTGSIFVAKFNPDLGDRVYMTFIGDRYQGYNARITEVGRDIAVDEEGNVYITGQTLSHDQFPVTEGAFDTTLNDGGTEPCSQGWTDLPCTDAFAVKLNASGRLQYATYLGGSYLNLPGSSENAGGDDMGMAIAVDGSGHMYLAGVADSQDFPTTPGAYDQVFADVDIGLSRDVFVVKLNPAGGGSSDLVYGSFVGTGFSNYAHDIAVDEAGVAYVTGYTQGEFPVTAKAYDTSFGGALYSWETDVFFFKLNPAGSGANDLLYSTYLGGDGGLFEAGNALALGEGGEVYLTGATDVPDFPLTPGAFMTSPPTNTLKVAFVTKLAPAGDGYDLAYSTLLGGGHEEGNGIAVDDGGHVYVVGETLSPAFPTTPSAFDTTFNIYLDVFVARLNPAGGGTDDLLYGTYLGSGTPDSGQAIALAAGEAGVVVVVGDTNSAAFPVTPGAYDTSFGGGTCGSYPCADGFVARLDTDPDSSIAGRIVDGDGTPLAGVRISAGAAFSATSDLDGRYAITLPAGTYTLVPTRFNCSFDPPTRTLSVPPALEGQDFVGECRYEISGRVLDDRGQAVSGAQIAAGATYSATADASGRYTLTVLPGDYTLVPLTAGYFWLPPERSVSVPPDMGGQDFTGTHVLKSSSASSQQALAYGEVLSYTLRLVYPQERRLVLYDQVPAFTSYVGDSLLAPDGVAYRPGVPAISGTLTLAAGVPVTLSFAVRVGITGTSGLAPFIVNRACVYPPGGGLGDCEWSNDVRNPTYVWRVYLPVATKD